MRLRIAEQYISAFSKISTLNKSILVPGNGLTSTITQALGISKALEGSNQTT